MNHGPSQSLYPPERQSLCALILAAGLSTRMQPLLQGRSKALCKLQGKPLLERCCAMFKQAGIERIYVVTGHERAAVSSAAQNFGATPLHNANFRKGMFSSILTGLRQLSQDPLNEGMFLLPVDIPLLKPTLLEALLAHWSSLGEARQQSIIIPEVEGEPGHPPLIGRGHWPAIMQWGGEGGLQGYVASLAHDASKGHAKEEYVSKEYISEGRSGGENCAKQEGASIARGSAVCDSKSFSSNNSSLQACASKSDALKGDPLSVHRLEVSDSAVLWDIDTPDDLESAIVYLRKKGA